MFYQLQWRETVLEGCGTYFASNDLIQDGCFGEYRAAQSYEVNEDFTTWTFHLRKDALWSDGGEVTSADFKNTIVRALDPESGSGYAVYLFPILNAEKIYNKEADIETLGVELPDDKTVVFILKSRAYIFLIFSGSRYMRLPARNMRMLLTVAGRKIRRQGLSNGPAHFWLNMYRISILR